MPNNVIKILMMFLQLGFNFMWFRGQMAKNDRHVQKWAKDILLCSSVPLYVLSFFAV